MDLDSKLIAEAYSKTTDDLLELIKEDTLLTEQEESWWRFAIKVLDPTGITSYGDLSRAAKNYNDDQSAINFALLLLGVFNVLPNFGLLAAGWGGIGWVALKGALKASVSKSPQAAVAAANRLLSLASKTPGVSKAFDKGVETLVSKGVIDKRASELLTKSVSSGKLVVSSRPSVNADMAKAINSGGRTVGGAAIQAIKKDGVGTTRIPGIGVEIGGKWKAFSRAAATFGPFGTGAEYPGWAPKSVGGGIDEMFGMFVGSNNYQQNAAESAQRLADARQRLEELKKGTTT